MQNFLPKKLEKVAISKEKMLIKCPNLFNPLGTEHIKNDTGIEIENKLLKINLQYKEIKFDIDLLPENEEQFIGSKLDVNDRALIRFLNFQTNQYVILESYRIEDKISGSVIDLSDELEKNTIYVKRNGNDVSESASHYMNTFIKLNIEPKSTAGLLTMMHEIGHKRDPSVDPIEMTLVSLGKEKDISILQEEIINHERYAWAYSLNKLRPFLKSLEINSNDIELFVHKWALGSYSASIDSTIMEEEMKGFFSKFLKDFLKI